MPNLTRATTKRLGEILIASKLLTEEQVQDGLKRQKDTGGLLGEIFVRRGYLSEDDIAECIGQQFGLPVMHVAGCKLPDDLLETLPLDVMQQCPLVVVDASDKTVTVAVAGPLNADILADLRGYTGRDIKVVVTLRSEVDAILADYLDRKQA